MFYKLFNRKDAKAQSRYVIALFNCFIVKTQRYKFCEHDCLGGIACLCEKGENSCAVVLHSQKVRVVLVIVPWGVLVYKDTIWSEHIFFKYEEGYFVDIFEGIGRACEYKVILLCALFHEFEYIAAYDVQFAGYAEGSSCFFDKIDTGKVAFDKGEVCGPARCEFVGNAAGAAKEVEGFYAFEVDKVAECIEQAFFGHFGCGPCRYFSRRGKPSATEKATYNAHAYNCCNK